MRDLSWDSKTWEPPCSLDLSADSLTGKEVGHNVCERLLLPLIDLADLTSLVVYCLPACNEIGHLVVLKSSSVIA